MIIDRVYGPNNQLVLHVDRKLNGGWCWGRVHPAPVGYHFCLINLAILLMRIYGIIYEGWK
jgi:hypothetical protein